jgi:hypothetical protein
MANTAGTRKRKPRAKVAKAARASSRTPATKRWSKRVNETSDAMDLENGVFKKGSARAIALSLKRSVERSKRRKSPPFRSAMSMLNFYINRAGKQLGKTRLRVLDDAKLELRHVFGRA